MYTSKSARKATDLRLQITPPESRNSLKINVLNPVKAFLSVIILTIAGTICVSAQSVALKTNLLYDATATVNLGAEMRVAPRWSVDLSGNLNAWNMHDGARWKHWLVQPEVRYWLCEATAGHFFALHALGGKYNVGHIGFAHDILGLHFSDLRDFRYQGWFTGAGIGYGYSWLFNPHWSMECELALGWIHTKYNTYECKGCGKRIDSRHKDRFAPTKLAVNIVYVF